MVYAFVASAFRLMDALIHQSATRSPRTALRSSGGKWRFMGEAARLLVSGNCHPQCCGTSNRISRGRVRVCFSIWVESFDDDAKSRCLARPACTSSA